MGLTKTEHFTETQNELASIAKAIAHPARVAILEYLAGRTDCMCGDIVDVIPLAQATVSQHLKELKQAGLIKGTIEGNSICYCIDEKGWEKLNTMLSEITVKIENMVCCK